VNWQHLKTFLWLRWRLVANRNRRAGSASVILQILISIIAVVAGAGALVGGVAAGFFGLPQASPEVFLLIWDGIVIAFLFFWMTELLVELQRSELLSLDKFLHLPVTLGTAFLINYIGSITSVGALIFFPLMIGLAIGLVFAKGLGMLLLFPLIAAFALMVTALTHQFRGWLASLMVNQRRRRTIISVATLTFILIVQAPNFIGFVSGRWGSRMNTERGAQITREIQDLDRKLATREITAEEHRRKVRQLRRPSRDEEWEFVKSIAGPLNQVIPLGWLPFGAASAFEGRVLPCLLGIAGLALIGAGSLRRSYSTTMRLYTGQFTGKAYSPPSTISTRGRAAEGGRGSRSAKYPARFLERRIPRLSEQASVVAVASLRSILRAPEAKLMLLSPIFMMAVFGGIFFRPNTPPPPELIRPLMASGAFAFIFFMMLGMVGNQFSFDRAGFRTYVLSPAQRKDILLGKNLSMAPFLLGFMILAAFLFQFRYPMRIDHFVALLFQMAPMYLVFCLIGNILSIIAPMPTAAGSMKPVKPKAATVLIHMAFVFLFPLGLAPTLIPLGIEFLFSLSDTLSWIPVYLILAIVECALAIWLYPVVLEAQGQLLQRRERRILEIVTTKTE
jgi:hypothetical protein